MKKIAFVIDKYVDFATGGEPSIHSRLIRLLHENNYKVDVYCRYYVEAEDKLPIDVYPLFDNNKDEYIQRIKESKYDLIVGGKFALKYDEISPDIITLHAHSDLHQQKSKFGFLYYLLKPRKKRIEKECSNLKRNANARYVFCSEVLKNDYSKICEYKNSIILNPYPNFKPTEDYQKKENEVFTFGISALGFQNKGGYLTIKSAFLLKLLGKKFKLRIIYRKDPDFLHKALINVLGLKKNIEFLRRQNDMTDFYSSIDCLILASQLESYGMVALEALAYNLPVIASSNSGFSEVITDGVNGYVFKFDFNRMFNLFLKMKEVYENKNLDSMKENIRKIGINTIDKYNDVMFKLIEKSLTDRGKYN